MQILDQILAVFGPKILIFMGVRKSFGTNITENHLDNLSALFFGQSLDQMGQKCRYLAKYVSFWPNLTVFEPKILVQGGWSKVFGILISGNQCMKHLIRVEKIDWCGSNWPLGTKMCNFDPKIGIFWAKCQFFVW